jgi:hypothetical protein
LSLFQLVSFHAIQQEVPKEEPAEKAAAPTAVTISNMSGYTPTYSASFAMGDAGNAETVLALYKSWDNGNLEPQKNSFADSVNFYFSDGRVIGARRDSAIATMQAHRNMFSAVKNTVNAIFPAKSVDKNVNFVCIWATEYTTDKKGKKDSIDLQETWGFDKDGKVNLVYQYSKAMKPPKDKINVIIVF